MLQDFTSYSELTDKKLNKMNIFILISRRKTTFQIFGILMFVNLILYSYTHNSTNHDYGGNYRQMANQKNSLVSLIRKNIQKEENRTIRKVKDYEKEFEWPLYGNISILMSQLERRETPSIAPFKNHEHSYLINNQNKCNSDMFGFDLLRRFFPSEWISYLSTKVTYPYLLIVVRSAVQNFDQRNIIRRIWGNHTTSVKPFQAKTMFILGYSTDSSIQDNVMKENEKYNDLIQVDVLENYYNLSFKTLMGLKWAYENCFYAKYFLFIDNDYYLSIKNLLLFLRNPSKYEEYTDKHKTKHKSNATNSN